MRKKINYRTVFKAIMKSYDFNFYDLYPGYSEKIIPDAECMFNTKENAIKHGNYIADVFNSFPKKFPIYRAISVNSNKEIRDIDDLGESWSFDLDSAKNFGRHNGSNIIMAAFVNDDNIDWEKSLGLYVIFSHLADFDSEHEIVVKDTSKLQRLKIMKIKEAHEIGENPIFKKVDNLKENIRNIIFDCLIQK